jgi:hypothetical protein
MLDKDDIGCAVARLLNELTEKGWLPGFWYADGGTKNGERISDIVTKHYDALVKQVEDDTVRQACKQVGKRLGH